jgi:NADH-quinone oxidoreductase subunit G
MITIYIDDKPYSIEDKGQNLLEACLSLKLNLPYFCWHPVLRSAGACRQCAVKVFKDTNDKKGRLAMACVTPVQDGFRASIYDPQAVAFRAQVIEWLMMNHPHDCAVCDEGGECHLQDMTVMTGHCSRRYRFSKRTFRNQDLGPFVNHEMNRCIECYRCVRFYRDYAGGRDFNVFGWHNHLYFGRDKDGKLESPFSGNLVEVCPTGVFTDKTFKKHYTRKWDLTSAPSICPHCCLGCNTFPAERDGMVRRVQNRYNPEVNGYFLCDRGRFGYEYANSPKRLSDPCIKGTNHKLEPTTLENAIASIPKKGMVGIGSPRASLEGNFALRELVGPENFYHGISEREAVAVSTILDILQRHPDQVASLQEAEKADAVFILGEDPTQTAPRLSLCLRQAVLQQPKAAARACHVAEWDDAGTREVIQDAKGPLFIAASAPTLLDDVATECFFAAPADIARLGFCVAHELDPSAPTPSDASDEMKRRAQQIAEALRTADHPLVVSGTFSDSLEVIQAAANIAQALNKARIIFTLPECNSFGLALLEGKSFEALLHQEIETLIILENDLYRHLDSAKVQELLSKAKRVVVIDSIATQTTTAADVLIPVDTMVGTQGTLVNFEGRAQRFFKVVPPHILSSWRICTTIQKNFSGTDRWPSFEALWKDLGEKIPVLAPVATLTPNASFRIAGQKIPRDPNRWSGRTSLHANTSLHEQKPPSDDDSPLAFSMEGTQQQPPASLIPRFWAPGWNSVQSVNKFLTSVGGPYPDPDPGMRCLPSQPTSTGYFDQIPVAFQPRSGEWLFLSAFHIFGSEELSALCPAINSLVPAPYVAINRAQAERLGFKEGRVVHLSVQLGDLAVHLDPKIPEGIALIPWGIPGLPLIETPTWGTIR